MQLFGMPEAISADIAIQRDGAETDDYFHILMRYRKLRVILHSGSLGPASALRMCIHGTRASFIKHGFDQQEAALKANVKPGSPGWGKDPQPGMLTVDSNGTVATSSAAGEQGNYGYYYAAMRDAINTGSAVPVSALDAIATTMIIEKAFESAKKRLEVRISCDVRDQPGNFVTETRRDRRP
jgi:predicted dehydrogenase